MSNHIPKEPARNKKDAWLTIGECEWRFDAGGTVGFDTGKGSGCQFGNFAGTINDVTPYSFGVCPPGGCAGLFFLIVPAAASQNMPSTITVHFPATGGTLLSQHLEGNVKGVVRFRLVYLDSGTCGDGSGVCAAFGWDLTDKEAADAYIRFKENVNKTVKVTWT